MSWKKKKLFDIHQALNSDPVDIETLRKAAVSEGGLLTDEIRRKVWPKLLNVNVYNLPAKPGEFSVELNSIGLHNYIANMYHFIQCRYKKKYNKCIPFTFTMTAVDPIHLIDHSGALSLALCVFHLL